MRKLSEYNIVETTDHYINFLKEEPHIFFKSTWNDLRNFADGMDYWGAISDGTCPNLGIGGWQQVVKNLQPHVSNARGEDVNSDCK